MLDNAFKKSAIEKLKSMDSNELKKAFKEIGSEPETNEEWFCQLSTEKKAKWLENKMTWAAQEQGTFTAKGWELWLKQPHVEKEIII